MLNLGDSEVLALVGRDFGPDGAPKSDEYFSFPGNDLPLDSTGLTEIVGLGDLRVVLLDGEIARLDSGDSSFGFVLDHADGSRLRTPYDSAGSLVTLFDQSGNALVISAGTARGWTGSWGEVRIHVVGSQSTDPPVSILFKTIDPPRSIHVVEVSTDRTIIFLETTYGVIGKWLSYDSDGIPQFVNGGPGSINKDVHSSHFSSAAATSTGFLLLLTVERQESGNACALLAQLTAPDGSPVGQPVELMTMPFVWTGDFVVPTTAIATISTGFVVTRIGVSSEIEIGYSLVRSVIGLDGDRADADSTTSVDLPSQPQQLALHTAGDGILVTYWLNDAQGGDPRAVAALHSASGDLQWSTHLAYVDSPSALSTLSVRTWDGGLLLSWEGAPGWMLQRIDSDGAVQEAYETGIGRKGSIAMDDDGTATLAWLTAEGRIQQRTVNDLGVAFDLTKDVEGGPGPDYLMGGSRADSLRGAAGNDRLDGLAGADTLTGGSGADEFVFSTAPVAGVVDTITDFQVGIDRLLLDASDSVFAGLSPGQQTSTVYDLTGDEIAPTVATRLIYDPSTGHLSFDADGIGADAAITFTALANRPGSFSAADIFIV